MTSTPDSEDPASAGKRQALRDGIDAARHQVSHVAQSAYARARDGVDQARDAVSGTYASSRDHVSDAYSAAREKARAATQQAAEGIETNPMVALFGGLAIGAVIGALLPRTERETRTLGAVGEKLQGLAREAADTAREAGQDKLAELGLTREKARETVKSLLDGAFAAATTASGAALESARQKREDKA